MSVRIVFVSLLKLGQFQQKRIQSLWKQTPFQEGVGVQKSKQEVTIIVVSFARVVENLFSVPIF